MTRSLRRVSGSQVGALRQFVHACDKCNHGHATKPFACEACGWTTFILFDSRAEWRRYGQLLLMLRAKQISDLERQPKFPLLVTTPGGASVKIGEYRGDFRYLNQRGQSVVEDVKGNVVTDIFEMKKKHVEAQYGVVIHIVKA